MLAGLHDIVITGAVTGVVTGGISGALSTIIAQKVMATDIRWLRAGLARVEQAANKAHERIDDLLTRGTD